MATLQEIAGRLTKESLEAYSACPFSPLSRDYFSRFSHDPEARPEENETALNESWRLLAPEGAAPVTRRMAEYFADFLERAMGVRVTQGEWAGDPSAAPPPVITLEEQGGGAPDVAESFTLSVAPGRVRVRGADPNGLRDGIVRLTGLMGLRQAPFLTRGEHVYTPRLRVRLGNTPWQGGMREHVFMGYNALFTSGGSLYALSQSNAIPELAVRRVPGSLDALAQSVASAQEYGLKTYCFLDIRQKFPENDPVFAAHPEIRGARTWKADGEFVLCTEHPLVRQWMAESVEGILRVAPHLNGLTLIIGGEGFYHCFMRPYGVEKGHTSCPRCEALGSDTVVSNLCNLLAEAARRVNPEAEVIAWPYSAEHVWSADEAQTGFIAKLKPGTAIHSEMEKSEFVEKPDGVRKNLWDYSIDMIGPGPRAAKQIAACQRAGIPIYMKSEPELSFEAPRLPHVPCLDRWYGRAEALATCGASGAWVFPAFRPNYGSSAAEVYQYAWWSPAPERDKILEALAARIAGREAGPHLREAWRHVSDAIPLSPELPPYYTGPYYLGPAHPLCCDPEAELPEVFFGYYLFMAEISDEEGLKKRPTFFTEPRGDVPVFARMYREMEALLKQAYDAVAGAEPLVPERCRMPFDAEVSAIRWFYHTARTHANFYESCQIRDRLRAAAAKPGETPAEIRTNLRAAYRRWREILEDERNNTETALPLVERDMRLDCYYGSDHTFSHAADMMRAKLRILDIEQGSFLPSMAKACGIDS